MEDLQKRAKLELSRMPIQTFAQAISDITIRWHKCLCVQGAYFEGLHIPVDVEQVQVGANAESSESSEESD